MNLKHCIKVLARIHQMLALSNVLGNLFKKNKIMVAYLQKQLIFYYTFYAWPNFCMPFKLIDNLNYCTNSSVKTGATGTT